MMPVSFPLFSFTFIFSGVFGNLRNVFLLLAWLLVCLFGLFYYLFMQYYFDISLLYAWRGVICVSASSLSIC